MGRNSITICVFIDGLGWKILGDNPFLEGLCRNRKPVDTLLGYSSTCDPTYLTGVSPQEHRHFSFFYWDPANSPFGLFRLLSVLPSSIFDRGRVRHWLSRLAGAALGYTGYFQLYSVPFKYLKFFNYSEKKDIYQPGGIVGGQPTIFDHLRRNKIPHFLADWRKSEEENFALMQRVIGDGKPKLAWMFCGGLDGILHCQGTHGSDVRKKLDWYEKKITEIVELARSKYDDVHIHVFSDHGMADVTGSIDLISMLDATGLKFGVDYGAMFDSTMARFWFLKPDSRERIAEVLAGVAQGRVLSEDDLARFECNFPGHQYGELFFLCDPGILIVPSFMGLKSIPGMHGYDPEHVDSIAMYMTNNVDGRRPEKLADIFGVVMDEVFAGQEHKI
jgi:predicted AlkP superfamily pyrophosphatase or phosphodiesterase